MNEEFRFARHFRHIAANDMLPVDPGEDLLAGGAFLSLGTVAVPLERR
jgi:hypothetical protein